MLIPIAIVAGLVVILVAIVLIVAATKPNTCEVQRSATINAAADKIFAFLNDFHQWPAWSPFEKLDPNMKKTYSGAPSGKGAVYEWSGNAKAGIGRAEIIESTPSKVAVKLDFLKPFEGHNVAVFTMLPKGNSTEVTWAMSGPSPFMMKVMRVFINMDTMIGKDFAEGLANLKALAEK
jgi:hypothetical protein